MDHLTSAFNVSHRQAELHKDAALIQAGRNARKGSLLGRLRGLWPFKSGSAAAGAETEPDAVTVPLPVTDDAAASNADDAASNDAKAA